MESAKDFVGAMAPHLAKISPGIQAVPKVGKSIMRINRETRFSKDTTPYKDWLSLWFWEGDGKSRECPGFYFGLGTAGLVIGAGMHRFGPPYLAKYRDAVGDSKFGKALAAATAVSYTNMKLPTNREVENTGAAVSLKKKKKRPTKM